MKPPRVRSRPASRAGLGGWRGRRRVADRFGPGRRRPVGDRDGRRQLDVDDRRRRHGSNGSDRVDRRSATSARPVGCRASIGSSKSDGSGSQSAGDRARARSPGRRPRAVGGSRRGGVARRASRRAYPAAARDAAIARGERLGLVEPKADDPADRVVADGHAVERVGRLDRAAVVGDDDELGLVGEAAQRVGEAADVRLVERRVDLVEDAERDRPDLEHREQQGDRGQGPLAARQHRQRLRPSCPAGARRSRCRSTRGRPGRSATAWRSRRRRAARSGSRTPPRAPGTSSGTGRRSSCRARR